MGNLHFEHSAPGNGIENPIPLAGDQLLVAELPPPGSDVPVESIQIRAAGSAGNTALTLAHLGSVPQLVGCVGDDHFGRFILHEFTAIGIREGLLTLPDKPTGISIAFEAPGRDRSFLTMSGSLEAFEASMVPPESLTKDFVLLCGYFTLPALRGEPALRLLQNVHVAGGRILFDSDWAPEGWIKKTQQEVMDILPLVDIFLPSEDEAKGLTGLDDPVAAAQALQEVSGRWVVLKLGPDGCVALGPRAEHRITAPSVPVSDTTGAGDAFNGGLLYALSDGMGWLEALHFATRVASTVVSRTSDKRYPALEELVPLT